MAKYTKNKTASKRLAERLQGTDTVRIGTNSTGNKKHMNGVACGSMEDVAELVSGIKYLVRGWVPYGMVTMLVGAPGAGKSAFALYGLARSVATGEQWFSGLTGPRPGNMLWCDTEGTAAITVQRVKDWGIPMSRIKVPFGEDVLRSINLTDPKHMDIVERCICKYKTKLVVVDSLRGAHDGDENSSRVSKVLQHLAGIAERTNAAIVIIHHTRKLHADEELTADSSRGSNAIVAMVRSQLGIDTPNKGSDWCRLQMLKENLGLRPQPIGFRVTKTGLEFGAAPAKPSRAPALAEAREWLTEELSSGPVSAADVLEKARAEGLCERTLKKAKKELQVQVSKSGGRGAPWVWTLEQG